MGATTATSPLALGASTVHARWVEGRTEITGTGSERDAGERKKSKRGRLEVKKAEKGVKKTKKDRKREFFGQKMSKKVKN